MQGEWDIEMDEDEDEAHDITIGPPVQVQGDGDTVRDLLSSESACRQFPEMQI